MSQFASAPLAVSFNPKAISANPDHALGTKFEDGDRVFRYAKAGSSNISKGKLQLAPARKTNHDNVAWASGGAIGSKKVTVTLGATAAVANEYAGGFLVVSDATGEGTAYRISSHPAAGSGETVEITLSGAVENTALVSGSEFCLVHNKFNGVVEGTSSTQAPAGIPLVDVTAGYYCWLQTKGIAPALADETLTLGADLTAGTSTAGAVEEADDDTSPLTDSFVGKAVVAGVDTEYRPIELSLE